MAHVMKYTRAACGHMFAHYERAKDENGEYFKFGNEDIDLNRTHLNYNLAVHQQERQGDFIKNRCSEVFCMKRKDVNVMCSWVITQPKDFPMSRSREFFEQTYKFLSERYGKENVVSAHVHLDEAQPHMHFAFVPITKAKKKDRLTVAANLVIDKKELSVFYTDLENHLQKSFGFEVGILNGATIGGNKSINELKFKKIEADIKTLEEKRNELSTQNARTRTEMENNVKIYTEKENALKSNIDDLQKNLDLMNNEIIELSKIKSNIFSSYNEIDTVGKKSIGGYLVKKDDLESLKTQAKGYWGQMGEMDRLRISNNHLEEKNKNNFTYIKKLENINENLKTESERREFMISVILSNLELKMKYMEQKEIYLNKKNHEKEMQQSSKKNNNPKQRHLGLSK